MSSKLPESSFRLNLSRRQFIAASASVGASMILGGCQHGIGNLRAPNKGEWGPADLVVERQPIMIDGREGQAVTLNGSIPGPTLRFTEGEDVVLRVQNRLDVDTSVHWHGVILPPDMDGVPGVSYRGIAPGETFVYRFPIRQSGTYWYHSHSGFQEQLGMFGAFIIDPAGADPIKSDSEHVLLLSDWTFENPMRILARLKKSAGYYNFQKPTIAENGFGKILENRMTWGAMRMDPTDIADVTAATYTYLLNGMGPESNWTGLFKPGETVRLRLINASAATYFDVRIPGLTMTVVQADGQNIKPVSVDEFRIAVAETFDVIVEPNADQAYTIFAETMDRSGYARGTLAPRKGMKASIPPQRERPVRTMASMGMMPAAMDMQGGAMKDGMAMQGMKGMKKMAGGKSYRHGQGRHLPGNAMVSMFATDQTSNPGNGLENVGHRVLTYRDLRSLVPYRDRRKPAREIELHLTGVMERYMWSFDGKKFSEVDGPIQFQQGERLRLILRNDTMMEHPIHLHGMWMEVENGQGRYLPRKHTVNIKPAEQLTVRITADAPGDWAFHCHLLYHLEMGMFRVVRVS